MREDEWLDQGVPATRAWHALADARLREAEGCWRASARDGISAWHQKVAEIDIRFEWPSSQNAPPLKRALAHLPEARSSDWTIHVWNDSQASQRLPVPDWRMREGQINNRLPVCCRPGLVSLIEEWLGAHAWVESTRREAWVCYRDADRLHRYEQASPCRGVLHHILAGNNVQIVHASAFAGSSGAVMLAGPGGSGKSSTALRALQAGYGYIADDLCAIATTHPVRIVSLYHAAKLRASNLPAFPGWAPHVVTYEEDDETSAACFLGEVCPERLVVGAPLQAILLPRITGRRQTTLEKAGIRDVLAGVLPWTVDQLPGAGQEIVRHVFHGLARVPAWHLSLGSDEAGILAAVEPLAGGPLHSAWKP